MTNWVIIGVIAAGILAAIGAELTGVWKHGDQKKDTISEMWWSLRDRLGPWKGGLALVLGGILAWTWWHLTFTGGDNPEEPSDTPT